MKAPPKKRRDTTDPAVQRKLVANEVALYRAWAPQRRRRWRRVLPRQQVPKAIAVEYSRALRSLFRAAMEAYRPLIDALAAATIRKDYDDDQPRDENGRWTGTGAGTGSVQAHKGKVSDKIHPSLRPRIIKTLHALAERYPSLANIHVETNPDLSRRGTMATKSKTHLILNEEMFSDPAKLEKYAAEWNGMQVDPSVEGIVIHELGHILDNQVLNKLQTEGYEELRKSLGINGDNTADWTLRSSSVYGQEHYSEHMAESFVADWIGRPAGMHEKLSAPALEHAKTVWAAWRKVLHGERKDADFSKSVKAAARAPTEFPQQLRIQGRDAKRLLDEAERRLQNTITIPQVETLASKFATRTSSYQRLQLGRQVRSALGADPFMRETGLSVVAENFIAQNVSLIKRIPARLHEKIEGLVMNSVGKSQLNVNFADEIQKQFGVAERHATLIARDQLAKYYGAVNKTRQQELGVTKFIWRTVNDERVRDSHANLEGNEYAWDDLPVNERGEEIYPGSDIQCRCSAEPILDELADDVDEAEQLMTPPTFENFEEIDQDPEQDD